MSEKLENNKANIVGKIASEFIFNHETYDEKFYRFNIECERFSGTVDTVPCLISEHVIDISKDLTGAEVEINGSIRTFNKYTSEKSKLILNVFVEKIEFTDTEYYTNEIVLDSYICKEPIYRKTPSGREISDVLLAVNRPYPKSDYIPCIAWGKNARYISQLPVGTRVSVKGRLQSREYFKKLEDEIVAKTTYEVSINYINTSIAKEEM
jgi:primosomal replication protein N